MLYKQLTNDKNTKLNFNPYEKMIHTLKTNFFVRTYLFSFILIQSNFV